MQSDTRNAKGDAIILDPTTGAAVEVTGISKAQLRANQGDFAFHA